LPWRGCAPLLAFWRFRAGARRGGGAALLGKKLEEDALKVDFLGARGGLPAPLGIKLEEDVFKVKEVGMGGGRAEGAGLPEGTWAVGGGALGLASWRGAACVRQAALVATPGERHKRGRGG
jgi:hypothetical protein